MRTFDREGRMKESSTHTCAHCQRVFEIKPRQVVDYDFCRSCMAPICPGCAGKPCRPFEKALERTEQIHRQRRQFLLDLGAA